MSYKCSKCGNFEIEDGFVTMELGKCQKAFNELQDKYNKLLKIVNRAANNSCCTCCDECLACDAVRLLRDLGETK